MPDISASLEPLPLILNISASRLGVYFDLNLTFLDALLLPPNSKNGNPNPPPPPPPPIGLGSGL